MITIDIEINIDNVIIEGKVIERPTRVSRSVWLRHWENFKYSGDTQTYFPPKRSRR